MTDFFNAKNGSKLPHDIEGRPPSGFVDKQNLPRLSTEIVRSWTDHLSSTGRLMLIVNSFDKIVNRLDPIQRLVEMEMEFRCILQPNPGSHE